MSSAPISSSAYSTWAEPDPPLHFVRSPSASKLASAGYLCCHHLSFSVAGYFGFLKLLLASLTPHSPAPTPPAPRLSPPSLPCWAPSPALGLKVGPRQGPSLGPFFCFTYTLSLGDPIHCHGSKYHLHDNDFQIYISSTNILRLQTHISCSLTSPLR